MARSNPSSAQYQPEVMGCGAPIGKAKTPPGRSARHTPANSAGRWAGRKCPSAPKLTARSKASAKGRAWTSARTHSASGCAPRACASMPVLKSTPMIRFLALGFEDPHARAGAAAHVQSPAERAERAQRVSGRVKHAIGGAKRRVVELRSKQVVAALNRGQRLHRQFTQRRASRREHRPRVLPRRQTGPQPPDKMRDGGDLAHRGSNHSLRRHALHDRHIDCVAVA